MPDLVDLSSNNGHIDWQALAGSVTGRAVYLKATEGQSYPPAEQWYRDSLPLAQAAGLQVGAYHFANVWKDPVAQADHFVAVAGRLPAVVVNGVRLPAYMLDLEPAYQGDLTKWASLFLGEVERLTGDVGFYSYAPYVRAHISPTAHELAKYPLWLAAYQRQLPPPEPPWTYLTLWQNSSSGTVTGVASHVDTNAIVHPSAPAPVPQEGLMRGYEAVTIPAPDAAGHQYVVLPGYQFDLVSSVQVKANDDGSPVPAITQTFKGYQGMLAVAFLGLDAGPVGQGSVGLIIEHR